MIFRAAVVASFVACALSGCASPPPPVASSRAMHCPPLVARRASYRVALGNAFDTQVDTLLIGRDARAVTAADPERPGPHVVAIDVRQVAEGMPGYATLHGTEVPEPETLAICTIEEVDACAARVTYVCASDALTKELLECATPSGVAFEATLEPEKVTYVVCGGERVVLSQ